MTKRLLAAPLLVGLIAIAGCGGSSNSSTSATAGTPAGGAPANAKKGGTMTILSSGDVDYLDPGQDYYQFGYQIQYAVNRTLYSFGADDTEARPDLAASSPEVSSDGKTVTVHIKKGVKYAPPVNREITSKDIKYAIERGFSGHVPSAYASLYFGAIQGAPTKPDPKGVPTIPGIQTPDNQTLVFKLTQPRSGTLIGAMALPLTVPVPEEYAKPFDAKNPSTYNQHVAFVGPYMVQNDSTGKLTGYVPGKSITIVRNPNWDKSTDYRPAYLDRILVRRAVGRALVPVGVAHDRDRLARDVAGQLARGVVLDHVGPDERHVLVVRRRVLGVERLGVLLRHRDRQRQRHRADERARTRRRELEDQRLVVGRLDAGDRRHALGIGLRGCALDGAEVQRGVRARDMPREAALDRVLDVLGRDLAVHRRRVLHALLDVDRDGLAVRRDLGRAGREVGPRLRVVGA